MRVFDHPNMTNFKCPICGESYDEPVVLVGIEGTENDGVVEARQYHLGCIELKEIPDYPKVNRDKLIYHMFEEKK